MGPSQSRRPKLRIDVMDGNQRGTVVGVDGSKEARLALEWAMAKQDLFGPVTPVLGFPVTAFGDGIGIPSIRAEVVDAMHKAAEARLMKAIDGYPELIDRARLIPSHPGSALVGAAAQSALLVVGSRGRSAFVETLFGSVGSYCAKHAKVPLAVIPEGSDAGGELGEVIVGVDGSPNSANALEWALRHVASTGRVTAVGCWDLIPLVEAPTWDRALEAATAVHIEDTIAELKDAAGPTQASWPPVEIRVHRGDPRVVLPTLAKTADLLVVGARGHRGIPHLLLGSTTTSLFHHPSGPTVVIPGDQTRRPSS